jgi:hypothetical protein
MIFSCPIIEIREPALAKDAEWARGCRIAVIPNPCLQLGKLSQSIATRTELRSKSANFLLEVFLKRICRVGDSVSGN